MNSKLLVKQIISQTGLGLEEIQEMINELKSKLNQNLSEKLALQMIAEELAIGIKD